MKLVYADNAATTEMSERAKQAFLDNIDNYGNPSSLHNMGSKAAQVLDNSRERVAKALGCESRELYFTSGGSESDNWAIKGAAISMRKKGKTHIISTAFEHHAVLHTLESLEKQGFSVTYLNVYEDGYVRTEDLKTAITDNTGLVTIMYANNEIGTVMPIAEIGAICREKGIIFHTDAVQAVGHIEIDVKKQNIDLLSLSAHKFHGPKGIGALYIRKGIVIPNLMDGGAQERGKRAGTENIAAAAATAAALEEALTDLEKKNNRVSALRDKLIDGLLKIERSRLNGGISPRLSGNVSVCFEGVEGEALLLSLDLKGISASSGSACTSGSLEPSHVLLALGLPHEIAHGSLRLSLCDFNTEEDVDYILSVIPEIIDRLRDMSPVWETIKANEGKR
ncbi:MAG: cysteine desulfurase NifS [Firmicutes bacterium HGW-Firmicutes-21]|nr:MAG: cysteine desulfurase NifS [Firmicutes bacterium HGW-Firmicutes-21]